MVHAQPVAQAGGDAGNDPVRAAPADAEREAAAEVARPAHAVMGPGGSRPGGSGGAYEGLLSAGSEYAG